MHQDSEMLEVYTEDNKTKIGIADRGVVHYCNLWHREIACWVVNEKNEILLQRRSSNKKQSPNMLSVTAGHVDLNELPFEGSLTALGLPGRLTISVPFRIPAVARLSIARFVIVRLNARIASGIPGTRRSITSSVASGVTSL